METGNVMRRPMLSIDWTPWIPQGLRSGLGIMSQESVEKKSPVCATFVLPSCPLLPEVSHPHGHMITRVHAPAKCGKFYFAALCYAQSLWREAKPAQAILQLNKAFMADLRGDEEVLTDYPPPYAVLVWFLENRPEERFFGNPVRHFQHLATRVRGERKELRSWRAWACFQLSRAALPAREFPPDEEQIVKEGIVFPEWRDVVEKIRESGWKDEARALEEAGAAWLGEGR